MPNINIISNFFMFYQNDKQNTFIKLLTLFIIIIIILLGFKLNFK